jgi:hypothetical protein
MDKANIDNIPVSKSLHQFLSATEVNLGKPFTIPPDPSDGVYPLSHLEIQCVIEFNGISNKKFIFKDSFCSEQ